MVKDYNARSNRHQNQKDKTGKEYGSSRHIREYERRVEARQVTSIPNTQPEVKLVTQHTKKDRNKR